METAFDRLDVATGSTQRFSPGSVTLQDDNRWNGLRLEQWEGPANDMPETVLQRHGLVVNIGEPVANEIYWSGHRRLTTVFRPRTIAVFPERLPYRATTSSAWCRSLVFAIAPEQLSAASASASSQATELIPQFGMQDAFVSSAAQALADDVRQGYPSGPMYGEALEAALVAHMVRHYTAKLGRSATDTSLAAYQRNRVREYILDQLHEELRLSDLAQLVQMDVHSFARWFKRAFGIPPHRYVMRARIAEAKTLLRSTDRSMLEIALHCGFASHSHFATAFRQSVGVAPRGYRASTAW